MIKSAFRKSLHRGDLLLIFSFLLIVSFVIMPKTVHASGNIVNPNQIYSYTIMQRDIEKLAAAYPDLITVESLGSTQYGRQLWAVKLGRGEAVLFLNGSHHAREWMTTSLLMKMLDTYAQTYYNNGKIADYNIRSVLDQVSIWMVPMVNPDGVTLSQQGTVGLPESLAKTLQQYNGNSSNFSRWKANMQGIDLNRQYPANWNTIKNAMPYPWYQNYKGKQPAQAREVQMMMDFTYKVDPEVTISYHSSGEILFWHFNTLVTNLVRDKSMARALADLTGYSLVVPEKDPSGGGYKDWFIQEFGRPGFTIEIANYAGEGSVPLSAFNRIWSENKEVGLYSAEKSYTLWLEKQKFQSLQKSMSLLAGTGLYTKPGAAKSISSLTSQTVQVIGRKGDWYQINTSAGVQWIHPPQGALVNIENVSATAELKVNTPTYKYPDSFAPKVTVLTPQTVQVIGRWGTWLLADSGNGNWWLDGRKIELQWPVENTEPSSEVIEETNGEVQPQTSAEPQ